MTDSSTPDFGATEAAARPLPVRAEGQSWPVSLAVAAAIGASVVWAHQRAGEPLPGFWPVLVFLVVIAQQDTLSRRIPNWASASGLLAALGFALWSHGWSGLLPALAGIALPFVLLLAPYAARAVGAGDVKAFMVLGGFWGIPVVLSLMFWSILIAGVLAVAFVALRGDGGRWLRRWGLMARTALSGGGLRYLPPREDEAAARGLPLATAIGLATTAHLLSGGPLA